MKIRSLALTLLTLLLLIIPVSKTDAFVYFGGKVTDWQEQTSCPPIQAANSFLDAVCGVTGGLVCLNLEYGKLSLQGGYASPNAFKASFNDNIDIGVLQLKDLEISTFPLHFFQAFLNYGFTQKDSWTIGEAFDFTPTCNPCGNDIERKVFSLSGIDMDKMCSNLIVKTALSFATKTCDAALSVASQGVQNACPTRSLCFVGSSHVGLPTVEYNLCHPGFSVGGFRL